MKKPFRKCEKTRGKAEEESVLPPLDWTWHTFDDASDIGSRTEMSSRC